MKVGRMCKWGNTMDGWIKTFQEGNDLILILTWDVPQPYHHQQAFLSHTNMNWAMLSWANIDLAMSHLLCSSSLHTEGRHHLPVGAAETWCWESSGAPRGEKMRKCSCHPPQLAETLKQLRRILVAKYDLELHLSSFMFAFVGGSLMNKHKC